jgi:hypothetical protein
MEYIDIFHLECDKTEEEIMAGFNYSLSATDDTADLLFRINVFTNGLHGEQSKYFDIGSHYPLKEAGEEFFEAYLGALNAKEKYTGYLTEQYRVDFPFLLVEHVECYPAEMYWFYRSIPEEILRRIYVEKDGLPLMQYLDLIEMYVLDWDKGWWLEYDGTGNLIRLSENTDKRMVYLNELFWTNPKYYREKELMKSYGLSESNPMTFEWVVAHPKEAYSLVTITWRQYSFFSLYLRDIDKDYYIERDIPIFPEGHECNKEHI